MKLEPVTKRDNRNKITSKKLTMKLCQKMLFFCEKKKKNVGTSKIRRALIPKGVFSETTYV